MTRLTSLLSGGVAAAVCVATAAYAQQGPITGAISRTGVPPLSAANGVQVGDGVLLHSGVGVEAGYDSNVFYNDSAKTGASLMRVTPFLELTNTARNAEVPAGLFFDLRAALTYREYFSNQEDVSQLRAFVPTVSGSIEHNSRGTLAISAMDTYTRSEDAPYVRGPGQGLIIRNNNVASAQLRWSPGGGRLQGLLRYTNTLDFFETDYLKPANSLGHEVMADLSWRWLPKTALYLQVRQGYISYLNATGDGMTTALGDKYSSLPLRAVLGVRGLITEKTSVALALGYQNSFYSNGASTKGFLGSTTAAAELVVLPLLTTRIALGLRHEFQNSVIGNFFYNDGAYIGISQQTAVGVVGQMWGSYDHRRYYGLASVGAPDPRVDNLVQAGAMLDYFLKSWAYAGLSYSLTMNRSDYEQTASTLGGVNYTKHMVFARLGITY